MFPRTLIGFGFQEERSELAVVLKTLIMRNPPTKVTIEFSIEI